MSRGAPRRVLLITTVAVAGVLSAEVAQAYKLGGKRWPTRTITYHAGGAPKYAKAIRKAVRAWNTSGVRVRFRATSRRRARLRIFEECCGGGGLAVLGWAAPSAVTERRVGGAEVITKGIPLRCGTRVPGTGRVVCRRGPWVRLFVPDRREDPSVANEMAVTVAHELGHVLGLKHQYRRCALMGPHGNTLCPKPPQRWQLRCRLLEADDLRGAIRRYGGRMRPLAAEFCEASPAPGAPSELVATFDSGERNVRVSWKNPSTASLRFVQVVLRAGACTSAFGDAPSHDDAQPGKRGAVNFYVGEDSGLHCVAVRGEDAFGRTGVAVTTAIQVPPVTDAPDPERPGRGPSADDPGE